MRSLTRSYGVFPVDLFKSETGLVPIPQNSDWRRHLSGPVYEASILRRFPNQEVRKLQFDVEDAFRSYLDATATPHNVPALPINGSTRFHIAGAKSRLEVGDNAATLNMSFAARPASGLAQPLRRAAKEMDRFDTILANQSRFFYALTLSAAFSATTRDAQLAAVREYYSLVSNNDLNNVDTFTFTLGNVEDEIQTVYSMSMFQGLTFQGTGSGRITIDFDFDDMTDFGVAVKIEVSSRPSKLSPKPATCQRLVEYLIKIAGEKSAELLHFDFSSDL